MTMEREITEFRPLRMMRVLNTFAVGVPFFFITMWTLAGSPAPALAVLPAVAGVLLVRRGSRVGVAVGDRDVVIRNYLRTRTVPAVAVADLSDRNGRLFHGLVLAWRTPSGGLRRTPVMAFSYPYGSHPTPATRRHHDDSAELIWRAVRTAQARSPRPVA
jgi:hypothetical protein